MLIRYYLSLRMGAALAFPNIASLEIPSPTPIVRQLPSRLNSGFDERELIRLGGYELVVVREAECEPSSGFSWN